MTFAFFVIFAVLIVGTLRGDFRDVLFCVDVGAKNVCKENVLLKRILS